jgi:hypothetical protein
VRLKREKESVLVLTDIIIALVAYIEIERFRVEKAEGYRNVWRKVGGYEINLVQNVGEVWRDWGRVVGKMGEGGDY